MSGRTGEESPEERLDRALGTEAVALLAERALASLAGLANGGAVPLDVLASRSGGTRRQVARRCSERAATGCPGGAPYGTPLDLATQLVVCGRPSSERSLRAGFLAAAAGLAGPGGELPLGAALVERLRPVMTGFLAAILADPEVRRESALCLLLHAAAIASVSSEEGAGDEEIAGHIVQCLVRGYSGNGSAHAAGLRLLLRAAGRRPREGVTEHDIALAVQCLWDGFVLRHLLDPSGLPAGKVGELIWETATAMTEPGVFAAARLDANEARLLDDVIDRARTTGRMPDVQAIAPPPGGDGASLRPAPKQPERATDLARRCLERHVGRVLDLGPVAAGGSPAGTEACATVLGAISGFAERHPAVVAAAGDAPVFAELAALIEDLLPDAADGGTGRDASHQRRRAAAALVEAARAGAGGEKAWHTVLDLWTSGRQRCTKAEQ